MEGKNDNTRMHKEHLHYGNTIIWCTHISTLNELMQTKNLFVNYKQIN